MRPIEIVRRDAGEHYYDLMEEVLDGGWFYSGDDCCVGAMVYDEEWLSRQNTNKELDKVWFVSFYAGNLMRVFDLMPFDLKYVAFRRDFGNVKVYDMAKLKQKIGG